MIKTMSEACNSNSTKPESKRYSLTFSPINFQKFVDTSPGSTETITLPSEILEQVEEEVEQKLLNIKCPLCLTLGYYDYIVICSSKDHEKAKKYSDQVNQIYRLKGITIHEPPFSLIPRIVDRLQQAHERASRCFFFLSPSFIEEIMLTLHRNEAILNLFTDPLALNRGSVVLVHTDSLDEGQQSYEVPSGLKSHVNLEADKVIEDQQKITGMFYPLVFKRREGKEKTEIHKKRMWTLETKAQLRKKLVDEATKKFLEDDSQTHVNGNGE